MIADVGRTPWICTACFPWFFFLFTYLFCIAALLLLHFSPLTAAAFPSFILSNMWVKTRKYKQNHRNFLLLLGLMLSSLWWHPINEVFNFIMRSLIRTSRKDTCSSCHTTKNIEAAEIIHFVSATELFLHIFLQSSLEKPSGFLTSHAMWRMLLKKGRENLGWSQYIVKI